MSRYITILFRNGKARSIPINFTMRKAWKICDYINRHSHGVIKAEITKRKDAEK